MAKAADLAKVQKYIKLVDFTTPGEIQLHIIYKSEFRDALNMRYG